MEKEYKISWIKVILIIALIILTALVIWLIYPKDEKVNSAVIDTFNENLGKMREAGFIYFQGSNLPSKIGNANKITLGEMFNSKLLIEFQDEKGKQCDLNDSYIKTTKTSETEYSMKVYLSCDNMEDYIVTTIITNNDNQDGSSGISDYIPTPEPEVNTNNDNVVNSKPTTNQSSTPSSNKGNTTTNTTNKYYNITYVDNCNCPSKNCGSCTNNIYYSVYFVSNGGSYVPKQVVKMGDTADYRYTSRSGYSFLGWYLDEGLTRKYDFSTPVTNTLTLYAKWVKNANNKYTVNFDSQGGSNVNPQVVESGSTAKRPADPTKECYIFDGWYLNGTRFNFDTPISGNITLVAKWIYDERCTKNNYSVNFDSNGGSYVEPQIIEEGNTARRPANPTRQCYKFVAWHVNSLNGPVFDFNTRITSNVKLVAEWSDDGSCHKNNYVVNFDSNGGSYVDSQVVEEGNMARRPANPTRQCYRFVAWHVNSVTGPVYNFNSGVTSNVNLVAEWTDDGSCHKNNYVVNFDSNRGSYVDSQIIEEGNTARKPANPTRQCYQFVAWHVNSVTGPIYDFNTRVTSNVKLVAEWRDDGSCHKNNYVVNFDSNGGSYIDSQVVEEGNTARRPANPTKKCYQFVAWHVNYVTGPIYDFNTRVTSNVNLVAEWRDDGSCRKNYTVRFNENGGTLVNDQTVTEGGRAYSPSTSRSGYTFSGWYYNGRLFDFSTPIYYDITLEAKWTKNQQLYGTYCKITDETFYSISAVSSNQKTWNYSWNIRFDFLQNISNLKITEIRYLETNADYEAAASKPSSSGISWPDQKGPGYPPSSGSMLRTYSLKASNFNKTLSAPYYKNGYYYTDATVTIKNYNNVTSYSGYGGIYYVPFIFKIRYTNLGNCFEDLVSNQSKYPNYELTKTYYK